MTRDAVRERLGAPARRELGPDFVNWRYRRPAMEVTFKPRAITLFTRSAFVRGAARHRRGDERAPAEERGRRLALRVRRRPAALLRRELRHREAQHGLRYASPPGDVRHDLAQHAVALGV
jgi:hypothetical protein